MKRKLSIILGSLFFLGQAVSAWAVTQTFTVSATVPTATGVSVALSRISTAGVWTALAAGTTALSFDPMTYDTTYKIYRPANYYALNFGVSGGAGTPDITVTYTEGTNPNGTGHGLGYKGTATFAKEVVNSSGTTTETLLTAHGPVKRLIDLNAEHVAYTELVGGYPRIYVGLWGGATTDPTNGEPFTNGDAPGAYSGSLVVTTVVD